MIKRLLAVLLTLSIIIGFNRICYAAEPMMKIRLYAPNFMVSRLDSVLSYGVSYTDDSGEQKLITYSGEGNKDSTLGKYRNNTEFLIPKSKIPSNIIDYVYVTVTIKADNEKLEKRIYYYNSDGTSSLFKEGITWSMNQDLNIFMYIDSPYIITIKNDININDYYIETGGNVDNALNQAVAKKIDINYDAERGEHRYFDNSNKNVTSICKNDHVYVPITSLAELFKFKVDYSSQNGHTKLNVTGSDSSTKITLETGSDSYIKNGENNYFKDGMTPFISGGITYVPVRLLENFGMHIEYSSTRSMIYINPANYEI